MAETPVKNSRARRVLVVILVFLVLLLIGVSVFVLNLVKPIGGAATNDADGMRWVRSIYGYGKEEANQLTAPYGVGVGTDGTIWVPEGPRARVMGFNPDGSFKAMLHQGPTGSSPNALGGPNAVAEGDDGNLYISDAGRNQIVVMSKDNKIVKTINVMNPTAVAVRNDRIVVGSQAGFAILDMDGQPLNVVGSRGKADDQFDVVQGVAIAPDGTIYIADRHNNRISAYSPEGKRKWIKTMGKPSNQSMQSGAMNNSEAAKAGQMILPSGLTVDGAGRVVVADAFDFQITVIDPKDGKIIAEYGDYGTNDGQFVYPTAISYDASHDWFAVADTFNNRIQIVRLPDSGGSPLASIRASLSGPVRALLIPLLALILFLIAWAVWGAVRKARRRAAAKRRVDQGGVGPAVGEGA